MTSYGSTRRAGSDRRAIARASAVTPLSIFGANLSQWFQHNLGILYGTPPAIATVSDQSGNANNGTQGTVGNRPTTVATGIDFVAASSQFLTVADSATMDVTTQMVIGLAFTPDVVASGFPYSKGTNYAVQLSSGAADLYYTGGSNFIARGGTFVAGTPHRLIMAYDGTATGDTNRLRMWQEGTPITWAFAFGSSIPATLNANANPGFVGSFDGVGSFFDGKIRAVVMAKTTLSASGLLALDSYLGSV